MSQTLSYSSCKLGFRNPHSFSPPPIHEFLKCLLIDSWNPLLPGMIFLDVKCLETTYLCGILTAEWHELKLVPLDRVGVSEHWCRDLGWEASNNEMGPFRTSPPPPGGHWESFPSRAHICISWSFLIIHRGHTFEEGAQQLRRVLPAEGVRI